MNEKQVHKFLQRYLEATDCQILEKTPYHIMTKLSPQADRELTNRPYYWGFIDRTGTAPETMTFLFVTDKNKHDAAEEQKLAEAKPQADGMASAADAALSRSFGFLNPAATSNLRVPREDLYFGSRKLEQLFRAASTQGSYVYLFQEPSKRGALPLQSVPYTAWLGVNIKVQFACDRKREEIHSYGVSLATGRIVEQFHDRLLELKLTPRLPANVYVTKNGLSYSKALAMIEQSLERKLKEYDYSWAESAAGRLEEEITQLRSYYEPLLKHAEGDRKEAIQEQFSQREAEIKWQYEPRVTASAINCGIFHLEGID